MGKPNLPSQVLRGRRTGQAFALGAASPQQPPARSGEDEQGELHVRRIAGGAFEEVVPEGNGSGDEVRQGNNPAPLEAAFRDPPEEAQRESDQAIKCGAAKHHDLVVKLAEALVGIGSLQKNSGFLSLKNVTGKILLVADRGGGGPLAGDWVTGLDDPLS